jgi:hypothetical protein
LLLGLLPRQPECLGIGFWYWFLSIPSALPRSVHYLQMLNSTDGVPFRVYEASASLEASRSPAPSLPLLSSPSPRVLWSPRSILCVDGHLIVCLAFPAAMMSISQEVFCECIPVIVACASAQSSATHDLVLIAAR